MSEQLRKEIKDLKDVVETLASARMAEPKPQVVPKSTWTKYLGHIITVGVLAASGITGWATLKSAVAQNSENLGKQEKVIEKHSSEIENVKIQTIVGSQDVKHIKENIEHIQVQIEKVDVKLDRLLKIR